jgi:hypothetical protein
VTVDHTRLWAALQRGDAHAVTALFADLDEAERAAKWSEVSRYTRGSIEASTAVAVAVAWTAPDAGTFRHAATTWLQVGKVDGVAVAAALEHRAPAWLAGLDLIADRRGPGAIWQLQRELYRRRLVPRRSMNEDVWHQLVADPLHDHDRLVRTLAVLAADGVIDRAPVLRVLHDGLVRDLTWPRLGWIAELIEGLAPTVEELDA